MQEWLYGVGTELAQHESQSPWLDAIATTRAAPSENTSAFGVPTLVTSPAV